MIPPEALPLPKVRDAAWPRNGIDFWILDRLEKEGLKPSPEADPLYAPAPGQPGSPRPAADARGGRSLHPAIRPPTPTSGPSTASSTTRPTASAGRGCGSTWPATPTRPATAPTRSRPNIWRYRDWVIEAFNRNLPYDRFTLVQIAGDLLPDPSLDDRIATAFHRNTMTNTEGGTDDEEFRVAAIKDRVDTTMQVWMGLTMGCAKCHSPQISTRSLRRSTTASTPSSTRSADNDQPDESPVIPAPTPESTAKLREFEAQVAAVRARLEAPSPSLAAAQARWEINVKPANASARKGIPKDVLAILDTPAEKRTKPQSEPLARYFHSIAPELKPVRDELAKLEKARPRPPTVPVMVELPAERRRVTRLLRKGNFLDPGDPVEPGVPAVAASVSAGAPANRLGLARWLIDPKNPLTARVAVNRYWAQLFGTGLVETEEDFGTQGEPPSHPELLDWLAVRYRDSGWDTKAILRLIVTSATYRQSSKVRPELLETDPRNRLLARAPRVRLEAEMVRDQALALSGLLSRKVGGPSVFPPQPDGLWQAAFNGQRTWTTSKGDDRYRRGLYVFWRRTVPYPSMATFDAPSREICAIKRVRTNTPLQSFVTLNDPVYVEAAQALARRIVREGGGDVAGSCPIRAYSSASAGRPGPSRSSRSSRSTRPSSNATARTARPPWPWPPSPLGPLPAGMDPADLAAWTAVANVLLNLDSVLTKG